VAELPERLRFIIQARMHERSPGEIAADLGLCESRIIQLQARAWARLRPRLAWIVEREAAELEVAEGDPEDRAAVRWGDERAEAEACAQMGRDGLSQVQIAAALRLNPRTVKKRLASLGLCVERLRRSESSRLVPIAGFPGNREADDQ
jgi:DNA-directed RNA polymerase specialized sigma24 family protein